MKHLTILVSIIIFSSNINAQKIDSVFQPIGHMSFNHIKPRIVNKFDSLPEKIQDIVSDFIKTRLNDYCTKITFVDAQIYPVDSLLKKNIHILKENNLMVNPIPSYLLNYSFKDTSLGIRQYWITIGLDKLGQVINCNFPVMNHSNRKVNSLKFAKEFSDSLLRKLYPQISTKNYKIHINYNEEDKILIWEFCYLIEDDKKSQNYHCLLIDANRNRLVKELGYVEVSAQMDCCNSSEELPLEINRNKTLK